MICNECKKEIPNTELEFYYYCKYCDEVYEFKKEVE